MAVFRCFSEKRPGFDVEAKSLFDSLHGLLEIPWAVRHFKSFNPALHLKMPPLTWII